MKKWEDYPFTKCGGCGEMRRECNMLSVSVSGHRSAGILSTNGHYCGSECLALGVAEMFEKSFGLDGRGNDDGLSGD